MGAAIPALMGISTIAGLGATAYQIYMQRQIADASKEQAEANRQAAERAAGAVLRQGALEAGFVRGRGYRVIGEQVAGYAASGVDVSSASAQERYAETAYWTERDAAQAMVNAMLKARGYREQGAQFSAQAAAADMSASLSTAGSLLGMAGTTTQMASALYQKYQTRKLEQAKTDTTIAASGQITPLTQTAPPTFKETPIEWPGTLG